MSKYSSVDEFFKVNSEDPTVIAAVDMSAERLKALNEFLSLTKLKMICLRKFGFLVAIMFRLKFQWDARCPTAATDGTTLFMNPDFFECMSVNDRIFIICHELWHVALRHMIRDKGKHPKVYNAAADYVINLMLRDDGVPISDLRSHGCYNTKYRGMSTEQVYFELMEDLKKEAPKVYLKAMAIGAGGPGSGGLTSQEESQLKDALGLPSNMPLPSDIISIDPQDDDKAKEVSTLVASAYDQMSASDKAAGSMPGEFQVFIDEFFSPKIPWNKALAMYFNEKSEDDYSYRRPNRRMSDMDPMMKGRIGTNTLDLTYFFLDTSGSITDEDLIQFNSDVYAIKKRYNPKEIRIYTFDTEIRDEYILTDAESYEGITCTGRGGTDLEEVYEKINDDKPNLSVIFTDLCVNIPEEKPASPLIWIVSDNPNAEVPYGQIYHF